jgi:hypothetical protein
MGTADIEHSTALLSGQGDVVCLVAAIQQSI